MMWLVGLNSPLPYFVLMAGFIYFSSFLASRWKFFTHAIDRQTSSPNYHLPFEGLRGILAISVFFHHSVITYYFLKRGVWDVPPSNFYALLGSAPVTMFFFLTGYLFWHRAITKSARTQPLLFYKRRFLRLFPIYWTAVALILITVAILSHGELRSGLGDISRHIFQWIIMGLPFGSFPQINGVNAQMPIAGVMWSLRYEVIFYLAFPAIQFLNTKARFLAFMIAVWALYIILYMFTGDGGVHPEIAGLYGIIKFTALGFGFGMLTAQLKSWSALGEWLRGWHGVGLAGFALLLLFFTFRGAYKYEESLLLFIPFVVIAFGENFRGLLVKPGLLFMGMISYSTYLFHGFVLFVVTRLINAFYPISAIAPPLYWMLIGGIGVLVILFTALTYRYIEWPYLQ